MQSCDIQHCLDWYYSLFRPFPESFPCSFVCLNQLLIGSESLCRSTFHQQVFSLAAFSLWPVGDPLPCFYSLSFLAQQGFVFTEQSPYEESRRHSDIDNFSNKRRRKKIHSPSCSIEGDCVRVELQQQELCWQYASGLTQLLVHLNWRKRNLFSLFPVYS